MTEQEVEVVKTKKEIYEENKQKRLAEKERQAKIEAKKQQKISTYRNPIHSVWGKIVIWILSLAMIASILFAFIYLIIKQLSY